MRTYIKQKGFNRVEGRDLRKGKNGKLKIKLPRWNLNI